MACPSNPVTEIRTCNVCGCAPCLHPPFCRSCRQADRKFVHERRDTEAAWRRALIDDNVSIERAYAEINRRDQAAASTVEALMYSLRERGPSALQEPTTQRRLSEMNETQLREVCERLQKLKPHIARAWSPEETAVLLLTWNEMP